MPRSADGAPDHTFLAIRHDAPSSPVTPTTSRDERARWIADSGGGVRAESGPLAANGLDR
jgi:hypothetical protein